MDKKIIAKNILVWAKRLISMGGFDEFTVVKSLKLLRENSITRVSLQNAELIKNAGYEFYMSVFTWDKETALWELDVEFKRAWPLDSSRHVFKGLSWGYGGEGPNGLLTFAEMFGLKLDKNKVLGGDDAFNARFGENNSAPLAIFK